VLSNVCHLHCLSLWGCPIRALITGDTHCKSGPTNEFGTSNLLLKSIHETAIREACNAIVLNGDFWDEKHGVNYEILMLVKKWMLKWAERFSVYYVRGNHEVSIKSKPQDSLVELFSGLRPNIHVINSPQNLFIPELSTAIWFIPWYPAEEWIEYCNVAADQARNTTWASKRLLLSHIGLSEGTVSPSNIYTVNQKTRVEHLHSECYNAVLLSDYHIGQQLNSRVRYMGAPIPLAHGDVPDQGVWVVDTSLPSLSIVNVLLEGQELFPKYKTYELHNPVEIASLFENHVNYLRIKVPSEFLGIAQEKFRNNRRWTVSVLSSKNKPVTIDYGRMAKVNENDAEKILDIWLTERGLDNHHRVLALQYLGNVVPF
jgi:DNA repair exonuclease SbcCD nuclease subunit